jgi:riboflavin kinase/FMN adenylyltransferase
VDAAVKRGSSGLARIFSLAGIDAHHRAPAAPPSSHDGLRCATARDHAAAMTAVAIGKFDALHLGHRALVQAAAAMADDTALLTFSGMAEELGWPMRSALVAVSDRARILDDWSRLIGKPLRWLERPFPTVRHLDPAAFITLLQQELAVTAVAVGEDFRFGHHRSGGTTDLQRLAPAAGMAVTVVAPVAYAGVAVSSSRIRGALAAGDVAAAMAQLGRPHRVVGRVTRGDGRGRSLGFPTANCGERENLVPAPGVYACWAEVGGQSHAAALNIGHLPTVGDDRPLTVEAHLLDFTGDCYGQRLALDVVARLRDERRFPSLDALKEQLARDVAQVRTIMDG